ncbi:MAG: flagellar assembly protein FliW [Verrucomicrobia bacterium]|jgi:flagellar assembly factor FliW|nr:flagellar assembly protein FliW [Verrucomicrobiota bacterium]
MLVEASISGQQEFVPDETNNQFLMPEGLIGLPDFKKFELIVDPESLPFVVLRAIEGDEIQIPAVEPVGLVENYRLDIGDADAEMLGLVGADANPLILNVATIKSYEPQKVTLNLAAPILINRRTRVGKQVVLLNYQSYSTTHVLIDETA